MRDVRARKGFGPTFDQKIPSLDRRQLLRAGAWAAPVILLAAAAPAAAATGTIQLATWQSEVIEPNVWPLGISGPPNSTQYFDGLGGTANPDIKGTAGAGTVTSIQLTVTVASAGMKAASPTVSGSGWALSGQGFVPHADTIDYVFIWTGSVSGTAYGQFPLSFTLPGQGVGTTMDSALPKDVTQVFSSTQISGISSGSKTVQNTQ